MQRIAFLVAAIALAGCTTLDDFKNMSATDRATRVCNRDAQVTELRRSRQFYADSIGSAQEALSRGYRVHRQCQPVTVPTGAKTICDKSGERVVCREIQTTRQETRCLDTPVAILPDSERRNIFEWSNSVAALDQQIQAVYTQCHARVITMTAEQAYELY